MKRIVGFWLVVVAISFGLLFAARASCALAAADIIASQSAEVDGVKLHYLKARHDNFAARLYADVADVAANHARPGRIHTGWGVFCFVLAGGQGFRGAVQDQANDAGAGDWRRERRMELLGEQVKLVATDAAMVVLKDCGQWVLEEGLRRRPSVDKVPVNFVIACGCVRDASGPRKG
ncbi:MAG TPA: hypothetical protein VIX91_01385 [Candidatus Acidoferrum sp.]